MLRLLIDQDLDHVILRGLLLRVPNADVMTAHQVGLSDTPDPDLLAGAEEQKRIVVTHDRAPCPLTLQFVSREAKVSPVSSLFPDVYQ
jgi:predicted nuclease of predicted toxin-antitoxin system